MYTQITQYERLQNLFICCFTQVWNLVSCSEKNIHRVLKKMFKTRRGDVTKDQRKLQNKELQYFVSILHILLLAPSLTNTVSFINGYHYSAIMNNPVLAQRL